MGSTVRAIGEFHAGDRVAAFHPMMTPYGAYAEYAVAPASTVFHLPERVGFEEGATIPLVGMTAALTLFRRLALPAPWDGSGDKSGPLVVYGASSAVGCFVIKLAKAANVHPIVAVCGESKAYVEGLLDKESGDTIVDYRSGIAKWTEEVKRAIGTTRCRYAVDCISSKGTWVPLTKLVDPHEGKVAVVSGANKYDEGDIPDGVRIVYNYVGTAHSGAYKPGMPKQDEDIAMVKKDPEFAYLMMRYFGRMLARGDFEGHPYEVIPGGLNGVATGLQKLQRGEAKGVKFVYRINETEGL